MLKPGGKIWFTEQSDLGKFEEQPQSSSPASPETLITDVSEMLILNQFLAWLNSSRFKAEQFDMLVCN